MVIVPAVLPSSKKDFDEKIARFAGMLPASRIQIDVVDGKFAVPTSWPYTAPEELRQMVERGEMLPHLDHIEYEIDLMCLDAARALPEWIALGATRFTLHAESATDVQTLIRSIRRRFGTGESGVALGLAINVSTGSALLEPFLDEIEYVQYMGIAHIGKQGESFDGRVVEKIRAFHERHPSVEIQVDGGVSLARAGDLARAGASSLVVGSALLKAANPVEAFSALARAASITEPDPHAAREVETLLQGVEETHLQTTARRIRETIIEMLVAAGSGHTAGPLGMADVFTALYFRILNHDPKHPEKEDRDRLVLSNGHICPVLYATLAHAGYFPVAECRTLRKLGSRLQGHPEREKLPILETTSGPLGEGLAQAAGMAYALQMDAKSPYVFCLMSDGEQQEGNTWEAVLFAGKHKLANLIAILDRNYIQISGRTEDVMPLDPLADKYRAFNWGVIEVDGHNFEAIIAAVESAKKSGQKPVLIIANTIPGKGVKEIENDYHWHGKPPTKEEGKRFLAELRAPEHRYA